MHGQVVNSLPIKRLLKAFDLVALTACMLVQRTRACWLVNKHAPFGFCFAFLQDKKALVGLCLVALFLNGEEGVAELRKQGIVTRIKKKDE